MEDKEKGLEDLRTHEETRKFRQDLLMACVDKGSDIAMQSILDSYFEFLLPRFMESEEYESCVIELINDAKEEGKREVLQEAKSLAFPNGTEDQVIRLSDLEKLIGEE